MSKLSKICRSTVADIPVIMNLISEAQQFLAELEIDQWQDGYPNKATILNDISNDQSYVVSCKQEIVATVAILMNQDPTYNKIEGAWHSEAPYIVVHRIAVASNMRGKGVVPEIFDFVENLARDHQISNFRVDTHVANLRMQKLLKKNGFESCGTIYSETGGKRLAFDKNINLALKK